MARKSLFSLALIALPAAGLAQTQGQTPSPWQAAPEPPKTQSFDLSSTRTSLPSDNPDSRVVAGTEVLPNTMVGFGMFGDQMQPSSHSRSTVRDFSLPRDRKPAVGFSLKF
jgi:hypothetical protein